MQMLDPESTAVATKSQGAAVEVAMSRAAQEVQAAMVVAKRFPRDMNAAYARILQACKRKSLAEQGSYAYPRGGTKVTGPSIRLAEVLQQNWGNMEAGVIELERRDGESVAMAYAWDLETNSRDIKVFTVQHVRERTSQKGGNVALTDPRDIYELVANMGARRKRACILAMIPGDIVDAAEAECDKTLKGDNTEPLVDRVRKVAAAFMDLNVTTAMLEKRLQHNLDAINETELVALRKIYSSIKDGMSTSADWFPVDPTDQPAGKSSFGFKKPAETKPEEAPKPESPAAPADPEKGDLRGADHSPPAGEPSDLDKALAKIRECIEAGVITDTKVTVWARKHHQCGWKDLPVEAVRACAMWISSGGEESKSKGEQRTLV